MKVDADFDGGNIRTVRCAEPQQIYLTINKDHEANIHQWYFFRLTGVAGQDCVITIGNAGDATYSKGFCGYQSVASYDDTSWFRVPTTFDGQCLRISHSPRHDSVKYSYFAPFSLARHANLIDRMAATKNVQLIVPGLTVDRNKLEVLRLGTDDPGKAKVWVVARQHSGETMAEWWVEGFLNRLSGVVDDASRAVLAQAVVYVVPNMNPDGSRRGHHKVNGAGVNLNRVWDEPSMTRSPEVFHVRKMMQEIGVDVCMDIHGEEVLPYAFLLGPDGIPSLTDRQMMLFEQYGEALRRVTPLVKKEHEYHVPSPGQADLSICSNFVGEKFSALAMTHEQPFKQPRDQRPLEEDQSPELCRILGAANVDAIAMTLGGLRQTSADNR